MTARRASRPEPASGPKIKLPMSKLLPVSELTPHPRNPRTHSPADIDILCRKILADGWTNPIAVAGKQHDILAGHRRRMAALKLGLVMVPTIDLSHLSEAQRLAYIIWDNKSTITGAWDQDLLGSMMLDLKGLDFPLDLTGFDALELDNLLGPAAGNTDPDDAPPVQAEAVSRLGDVWTLGRHTLYAADCRDVLPTLAGVDAVVTDPPYGMEWDTNSTRFSGGHRDRVKIDTVVSDPPYGMKWDGKVSVGKNGAGTKSSNFGQTITGDDQPFDPAPFLDFPHVVLWGANHFGQRLPVGTTLVWIKRLDPAFGSFLSDAEVAWVKGNHGVYCQRDTSLMATTNDRGHPTEKPVAIMRWSIERAGGDGAILDPYCGSGTTLIAAEQMSRTCVACEIEPRYVDVCCRRFAAFSGTEPTLADDGRPFSAIAAERTRRAA